MQARSGWSESRAIGGYGLRWVARPCSLIQMMMRFSHLALSAAVLGACQRTETAVAGDCDRNATSITDSSIGPLYLQEGVGALRVRCAAVADTTVVIPMPGWVDTVSAKRVVVAGAPVLAMHEGDLIVALRVSSPGPRTPDGIEVGTTIARFKREPGLRVSQSTHTGAVLLRDRAHCGTVFELSSWGAPTPAMEDDPPLAAPAIASWSDTIRVTSITVGRCTEARANRGVDSAFNAREDSMSAAAIARDTLATSVIPPVATTPAGPAIVPPPPPPGIATTGSPATASELAALRRLLIVPVEGVTKAQLRDTYTESRGTRAHEALDIRAPRGTAVLSAADGTLMRLFDSKTGGLMVYAADPTDRFVLLYGHLDRYAANLRDGMPLKQGQVIGYVGTTGNAPISTPHLHFGILRGKPSASWSRGMAVNPYPLLVP
jgi:murein DD-endopeptidase MepM/ murein hydrolase activator NlpD